jgi:MarR family 2-MHQ and catechol resistance regulon transcriptional repressor
MGTKYRGGDAEVRALNAFITLTRASDAVIARSHRPLADEGLTYSQFGALEALYHCGPLCPGDLAGKVMRSNGSITSVIDGLARKGLVERAKSGEDRRFTTLNLTARGRALVRRVLPGHVDRIRQQFKVLSAQEQERLRELCRALGKGRG